MKIIEISINEFEDEIYEEYTKLFPSEEQREWSKIKSTYEKGKEKFYKIMMDNKIVGFFMIEKLRDSYYIDYFAIFKQYQNKGYGTQAIKEIIKNIVKDQVLCIEIEKEDENDPIKLKRANFYKKIGFVRIKSEYLLYNVLYTPYVYNYKDNMSKSVIDRIMFEYYTMNCGENEVKKNCSVIR